MGKINIEDARVMDPAGIQQLARDLFGVELTGTKPKMLKELEALDNSQEGDAAAEAILTKDVVLENINQGLMGIQGPTSKLVINKHTGMVFINNPTLREAAKDGKIVAYNGKPVLVNGKSVMAKEYVDELVKHNMINVETITDPPKEYLAA
jgi:hypothetical protein